ncbi:RNA polymerase factor sigma-32 [Candidatus Magnetaquicoccus inordinatus]|uniref:RNA polymerase factor sigma-32 n=1 Tax=Candidatus Magnetaquicoccus inordinatus TaxID=2496818 RepID=UPI00102B7653|nr:RNA polymerase factor sigma-32 [Candidatus Magnetaquicoccus inordinatus]
MMRFPVASQAVTVPLVQTEENGFRQFVHQAMQAPVLSAEEEMQLATRYRSNNDLQAAHRLVHAYLRLVIKTAREYVHYRLNLPDLVQEGTVGLMHAVKQFDPQRGARLASYAIWWIRAAIHDYILRSWRLVKIATTRLKRQLFFKLRQSKDSTALLTRQEASELAEKFATDTETILEVDGRMIGSDESLNQPLLEEGEEWIEQIPDHRPNQEMQMLSADRQKWIRRLLQSGFARLNEREQQIVTARYLAEEPQTLDSVAHSLAISRERVRQLEKRALEKLREFFVSAPAGQELLLPA